MASPYHPLLLLIPLVALYLYNLLYRMRFKQRNDLPQPPPNLLFGHLNFFGKAMKDVKAFGAGGWNHPGTSYIYV
jgi:hypothetical protein